MREFSKKEIEIIDTLRPIIEDFGRDCLVDLIREAFAKKAGRKPLSEDSKSVNIILRVPVSLKKSLQDRAQNLGVSVAEIVRILLNKDFKYFYLA